MNMLPHPAAWAASTLASPRVDRNSPAKNNPGGARDTFSRIEPDDLCRLQELFPCTLQPWSPLLTSRPHYRALGFPRRDLDLQTALCMTYTLSGDRYRIVACPACTGRQR